MQTGSKSIVSSETALKQDRLAKLISETANRGKPVSERTLLQNLEQWDSLAALDLVMAVEKEFNIELKPEEIQKAVTVNDLFDIVVSKVVI